MATYIVKIGRKYLDSQGEPGALTTAHQAQALRITIPPVRSKVTGDLLQPRLVKLTKKRSS